MYFDLRPKQKEEDFFNREKELSTFLESIKQPLSLILGLRRTGKTSLLLVGLNKANIPHVIIDCRNLPLQPSKRDILQAFEKGFNQMVERNKGMWESLKAHFKRVKGVRVLGFGVSFSWKETSLSSLVSEMNTWALERGEEIVLAFDEFQEIRGAKRVVSLLAHIYDYRTHISVVLTGSKMGLLYDALQLEDPDSPLYGRGVQKIHLNKFTSTQSRNFLAEGFRQYDLAPPKGLITQGVEKFDGIPGWLTLFGSKMLEQAPNFSNQKELLDQIFTKAVSLAEEEINNFLVNRRRGEKRYTVILKSIAQGTNRWSEIKGKIEAKEGRTIPSPTISRLLQNLVKASLLQKENGTYTFTDPIIKSAVKQKL